MDKIKMTWLQCQIPLWAWEAIDERRTKLNLKWADLLLPAVKAELDRLEADAANSQTSASITESKQVEVTPTAKRKPKEKAPAPTDAEMKGLAELKEVK